MRNDATPQTDERVAGMTESETDETIEASFPASDPPAWTLGTDHAHYEPASDDAPERGE